MGRIILSMDISALNQLVENICDEYVRRWKTEGNKYISVPSFEQTYLERNITPIDENLLIVKLYTLSKTDPQIPSSIAELPLQILRRMPIYLTKTLEIQIRITMNIGRGALKFFPVLRIASIY